jgi:hypothetical protein
MISSACPLCFSHLLNYKDIYKRCPNCSYIRKINDMITMQELNPHNYPTTPEIDTNLAILLERINKVRDAYNIPMIVTSGLRSEADQMRINPKAPHSNHKIGAAVDIFDKDAALYNWCKANEVLLVEIGLWMEERQGEWQHFQIFPPKSQHRWFSP